MGANCFLIVFDLLLNEKVVNSSKDFILSHSYSIASESNQGFILMELTSERDESDPWEEYPSSYYWGSVRLCDCVDFL